MFNYEMGVVEIINALIALAGRSIVLVEVNNQLIDMSPKPSSLFKKIIPILTSTANMLCVSVLWPELFPMGLGQALFFGLVGGFVSKKFYDEGLFNKKKPIVISGEGHTEYSLLTSPKEFIPQD